MQSGGPIPPVTSLSPLHPQRVSPPHWEGQLGTWSLTDQPASSAHKGMSRWLWEVICGGGWRSGQGGCPHSRPKPRPQQASEDEAPGPQPPTEPLLHSQKPSRSRAICWIKSLLREGSRADILG